MMIAVVVDTDKRRHEFATWAQAAAFADAVGMGVVLMPGIIDVVRRLADAVTKCGVIVPTTADPPSLRRVQHKHRFTAPRIPAIDVGADWLDRELSPLLDSILTKEV